ncbi:hypothetical protein QPM17_22745 [Marinobacter sp. TBZ242]|uniref:Uncharacterized protein n=1 Tax=Marinobacter azerbaijanicus TaxID=3050455 RepID=A0ABT7IJV2_9GAMM|nr:hypothetical protein [Marinobacter sp. TBZ242]MDL0433963.1 hypothetical protein [Marinobacter sp. TBZ242]
MSAGQDYNRTIKPGGAERINGNGETYIFCKFADRDITVDIAGRKVVMRSGGYQEFEPLVGNNAAVTLYNEDTENPAYVTLVMGTGTYDEKIIRGEVTVVPGLRLADGRFIADTRHDIELEMTVTDDEVKNYSRNQNVVTKPTSEVGFDNNKSVHIADDQYLYHFISGVFDPADNMVVSDLFTMEPLSYLSHDFYSSDGIVTMYQGTIKDGRFYCAVKGNGYGNWDGPNSGNDYEGPGIVSWPIGPGGLGAITYHVDGYTSLSLRITAVIWNKDRNKWLVQIGTQMKEVDILTKEAIDAAPAVMTDASFINGDSHMLYASDYKQLLTRSRLYDSETLEFIGNRPLQGNNSDEVYGYSESTGLYYLSESGEVLSYSYESGNKWAGAAHISAQCQGGRGVRKKGTVLRLPLSYDPGDYGATMIGPVIRAALTAYLGGPPPSDYLDHIYKLVINDGFSKPRVVITGSETFKRAKVADNFTVKTPVTLTLTIDNQLFNGD